MKEFYVVMQGVEIVRIFSEKVDAQRYVDMMSEMGYDDYTIKVVEGF